MNDKTNVKEISANTEFITADATITANATITADTADTTDTIESACTTESADNGCACCCRHKVRPEEEFKDLERRLKRIEGQIRGIRGMVEKDAYCIDILTQVSAATAALNSFSKVLLESHIKSCVAEDIREGKTDKLNELTAFLPKMMK